MELVIVESPSKAKTIEKYLGDGYKVIASKGHVIDLPKSQIGVEVGTKITPTYVVTNAESLKKIKSEFKTAKGLVLAVDPDREGEAIGWHIAKALKLIKDNGDIVSRDKDLKRIVFTEITKDAVQSALANPRKIDMNLVDAQQARRILDRLVGYKLSPLLWRKIAPGLSAGRVQSVAVRIIVDRETEREKFIADEYWSLDAYLEKNPVKAELEIVYKNTTPPSADSTKETEDNKEEVNEPKGIDFVLIKINDKKAELKSEAELKQIVETVKAEKWQIADLQTKTASRYPKPPFTTSTLQQAAANQLGMTSSRTMRTAQRLYEAGHITYMRTDSVHFSEEAITNIRKYISKEIGKEYLPAEPKRYSANSKLTQEAHEAVRPTHVEKSGEDLKLVGDQERLYRLIWKRAVACQMSEAKVELNTVTINVNKYTFQANGQRIIFPGFLKIYTDKLTETILPKMTVGQELYLEKLEADQHFTQPPARYSEASLIKEMEALGIGRPSTYAPTISTILARKYVEKDGKYFKPTVTGKIVTRLLVKHFPKIVDLNFTAGMEEDLDKIADGKLDWQKMGVAFYKDFEKDLKSEEPKIDKKDYTVLGQSEVKCPICGKKMVIKLGRFGTFLSCVDFPTCKGMMSLNSKGETSADLLAKMETPDFKEKYQDSPKTDDGRNYQLKTGRFGYFWAHPDYPKVKDARPLELVDQLFAKIYGKAPKASDGKDMILRHGKFGEFWAHPDYPKVKEVSKLDVKKVREAKKEFGV